MKCPLDLRGAATIGLMALMMPGWSVAATHHVPANYPNIQAAVNAASVGDTVLVAPGTYFENIVIHRRLTLVSEAGAEVTTIDGRGADPAIFVELPADHAVIDGFRVTHGWAFSYAGGITVLSSLGAGGYATIRRNIIEYNYSFGGAGGLSSGGHAIVEDNLIQYNQSPKGYGAMVVSGTLQRNIVRGNGGGLTMVAVQSANLFAWNIIVDNQTGRDETVFSGGGEIHHNTFVVSRDWFYPAVELWGGTPYKFHNNLIVHGDAGGLDCHLNGSHTIRCNDVWGGDESYMGDCAGLAGSDGNFSADPLFCNEAQGNYRLSGDSPCASAPECGLIGALDVGCGVVAVNGSGVTSAMPKLVFAPNPVWSAGGAHLTGLDHGTVVDIYDLDGRGVATLGPITSDPFHWHPSRELPSGVYFARTRSIPATTARFVLVR